VGLDGETGVITVPFLELASSCKVQWETPPVPSRKRSIQTILVQILSIAMESNRNLARNIQAKRAPVASEWTRTPK